MGNWKYVMDEILINSFPFCKYIPTQFTRYLFRLHTKTQDNYICGVQISVLRKTNKISKQLNLRHQGRSSRLPVTATYFHFNHYRKTLLI